MQLELLCGLARDLRPQLAPVAELHLDPDLEAEMDDALDEGLLAVAVRVREEPDVVRAQERIAEAVDGTDERHHELVRRRLVELPRRAGLLDAAVVHDDDLLGDLHRLLLVVGDEDGGDVDLLVQPAQPLAQLRADLGVEGAEGLVEQQHLRLDRERARQRHALLLAAGELGWVAVGEPVEPHEGEQLVHAVADLLLGAPADAQPEPDVVLDRHVLEGRVVLEDEADAALARRRGRDVLAVDHHRAGVRRLEPGDDAQQRRLAAPARAEQRGQRAVGDVDAHVAERLELAEVLVHVSDLDRHQGPSFLLARRASRFIASNVRSASRASITAAV